jgi:hypothetical protein
MVRRGSAPRCLAPAGSIAANWLAPLAGIAGVQGRAVARNIFLNGNTFVNSPRVDKRPFVGDFSTGASLYWLDIAKLDVVFTLRSEEFVDQDRAARFGGINLSFPLL